MNNSSIVAELWTVLVLLWCNKVKVCWLVDVSDAASDWCEWLMWVIDVSDAASDAVVGRCDVLGVDITDSERSSSSSWRLCPRPGLLHPAVRHAAGTWRRVGYGSWQQPARITQTTNLSLQVWTSPVSTWVLFTFIACCDWTRFDCLKCPCSF